MSSQRQGVHGPGLRAAANGQLRMGHECRAPPATALAVLHPRERAGLPSTRAGAAAHSVDGETTTPRHPATHVTPCYPAVHNVDSSFSHHRAREVGA
jgi:hypothetical protein